MQKVRIDIRDPKIKYNNSEIAPLRNASYLTPALEQGLDISS